MGIERFDFEIKDEIGAPAVAVRGSVGGGSGVYGRADGDFPISMQANVKMRQERGGAKSPGTTDNGTEEDMSPGNQYNDYLSLDKICKLFFGGSRRQMEIRTR